MAMQRRLKLFETWLSEQELEPKRILVKKGETRIEKSEFKTQSLGGLFPNKIPSGKTIEALYRSDEVKESIEKLKPLVEKFIEDNPNSQQFTLTISSGESQMTNPQEFKTTGSLGLARANAVKSYVEEIFSDLIKSKKLIISSPTNEKQVKIGETPYVGLSKSEKDANEELYKKEQFVNLDLKGSGIKSTKESDVVKTFCNYELSSQGGPLLPQDGFTKKE